jgi:glycosyltransferase involved in cell wall biosynthesis
MRASVVIPCRNARRTVADAVASAFAQTEPPAEVLVIDDASEDDSGDVAERAGAAVVRSGRRRNAGGARNVGIEAATGDVIAFLDADAVAPPDWLERTRRDFERDPEVVGVGPRIVDRRGLRWGELDLFLNHSEWIGSGPARRRKNIPTMGIVYRRDAIGPIRFPETNLGEDTSFALAVLERGGALWQDPEIVVEHRHERLDRDTFWQRQIDVGYSLYRTRMLHDRPGRVLVRFPVLLFLFPHLWIVLYRMIRSGYAGRAAALLPWLVAGEWARILGFFEARRRGLGAVSAGDPLPGRSR